VTFFETQCTYRCSIAGDVQSSRLRFKRDTVAHAVDMTYRRTVDLGKLNGLLTLVCPIIVAIHERVIRFRRPV